MKKLTLRLDDLQVETFATAGSTREERGTVEGRNDCTCDCCETDATCPSQDTCEGQFTCGLHCGPATQRYTCDGYGCTWGPGDAVCMI
jgi:hypothetical protein